MEDVLHPRGQGAEQVRRKTSRFQQRLQATHFAVITLRIAAAAVTGTAAATAATATAAAVTGTQQQPVMSSR